MDYYALTIAIAAPAFDLLYGVSKRGFWRMRILQLNTEQWAEPLVGRILDRVSLIDGHSRFLGWWVMSLLGTVVSAYDNRAAMLALLVLAAVLLPAWLYYLTLDFAQIVGWRRRIPMLCRFVGYGISIIIAALFG